MSCLNCQSHSEGSILILIIIFFSVNIQIQLNPMYQQKGVKGIVVQEASPHYGAPVQGVIVSQTQKYMGSIDNGIALDNDHQGPIQVNKPLNNIPDNSLLSGSGYCKVGDGLAAVEVILLTTKNFADIAVKDIKKLKVYKKSSMQGHHVIKLQTQNQERVFHMVSKQCYNFAFTCFWAKLLSMNIIIDNKQEFLNVCEGQVLKMSQFMKNWEPRYLLITYKDGLLSYRQKNQEPTLQVESFDQFWTRFQLIDGNKYIVFKFWHMILKQQFAVPLHRAVKWFKAFYSLLNK